MASAVAPSGYEILGVLDESGSGRLYKARQTSLDRLVALKVLPATDAADPDFLHRFREEAKAAAGLRHPNILGVCDQGSDPGTGTHYVAFEYVEGPSCETLVSRLSALPERESLELCYGVALGLACAEEHRIVHRDVQPANMVVTREGVPKLIELGIAKRAGDISTTAVGKMLKNAHYVSPEQALGLGELDTRADLYALGICLYRFVTGAYPFEGSDGLTIVTKHVNEDVPDPRSVNPHVSENLARLIAGLSARDPADRYPSARAACLDMARVGEGQPPLGPQAAAEALANGAVPPRPSDSRLLAGLLSRSSAQLAAELATEEPEEAPVRFSVKVYTGDVLLKEHEFDQDLVTIGRGKDCDIHIDNPIVSRHHAELHRNGAKLALVALPTTNGTSVDGVRVSELTPVTARSRVLVADKFRLTLELHEPAPRARPAPEPVPEGEEDTTTYSAGFARPAPSPPRPTPRPQEPQPLAPQPMAPPPSMPERPTHRLEGAAPEEPSPYGPASAAPPPREAAPESDEHDNPYVRPPTGSMRRPVLPAPAQASAASAHAPPGQASAAPAHAPPAQAWPARDEVGGETPLPAVRARFVPAARSELRPAVAGETALVFERNGREQRVACGPSFQVGKGAECDLRLQGAFAPRKAALIVRASDGFRVFNVGPSPDSVTLNGNELPDQALLQSGDRMVVYGLELRFLG